MAIGNCKYPTASITKQISATYMPNGEIDLTMTSAEDFAAANCFLQPTIFIIESLTYRNIDFWKLINFIFVNFYWLGLYTLRQTSPTTYPPGQLWVDENFDGPTFHPPTNIFMNNTLFQIYSSYLQENILPFFGLVPEFLLLNRATNSKKSSTTSLANEIQTIVTMKTTTSNEVT